MSTRTVFLAVTGLALAIAACSTYGTSVVETPNKPSVASVAINLPAASMIAGQTVKAVATLKDASGNVLRDRAVAWHSSSTVTATVSDSGLISAIAPGSTSVSASSEGVSSEVNLTVAPRPPAPVANVSVSLIPAAVVVGQLAHATALLKDSAGNTLSDRTVTWQSGNSATAVVSATGDVTAVGTGSTLITATSEGKSSAAQLTVSAPAPVPVASVAVAPSSASLQVNATVQLSATERDAGGNTLTGRVVAWSSSNAGVATVSTNGLVTAIAAGSATVSASSEGIVGNAAITVTSPAPPPPVPVASVSVSPSSANVLVGATTQLSAVTRDANNNVLTGRVVTWSSANAGVASVSSNGLVTGVGAGSTQITATSEGQNGTATINVSVPAPAPVASVSVSPNSPSLLVGETAQLTATTRDANNNILTGRVVTWSTADASIATVSSSGLVTAVAAGSVAITATSEGKTANANVTASDPTPPPPGGSNEPAGMTYVTDRPFNSVTNSYVAGENGWWDFNSPNLSVVSDATAPKSPTNVGALKFPAGWAGGNAPGGTERVFTPARTLYAAMWVKFSPNWQSHPVANKINFVWVNGVNRIYSCTMGPGGTTGAMYPYMNLQQLAANYNPSTQSASGGSVSANLAPNVAGQENISLVRGQWYKWEMVLYAGSPGQADGTVDWWINGAHVGHYVNIPFVAGGGDNHWTDFQWNPTWGGLGSTVSSDMYMYMDHIYLSTKP